MTTGLDPLQTGQKIGQNPDRINTATASRVGDEVYLTLIVNNVKEVSLILAPHVAASVIQALARAMR